MTGADQAVWWGLALFGLAGSALCSGLEIGVYTVNRVRLAVRAARAGSGASARVLRNELEHPERLLATLLIANNAFNYLGAAGITAILVGAGLSELATIVLNAVVLTPVIFVFGESLPKEVFRLEADRLTYRLAFMLRVFRWILTAALVLPLVRLFAHATARLLGGEPEVALTGSSRDRVAALLKEGASHGMMSESQADLVDRALVFNRTTVRDEMVPWAKVRTLSADLDRAAAVRAVGAHPASRFPVVDRRGNVVGVLRQIDLHLRPEASLGDLLERPVRLAPEESARSALRRMREAGVDFALVEVSGRPVGIVTDKDLFGPLVEELAEW